MKKLFSLVLFVAVAFGAMAAGRDSYTVVVSLDGFRWDYVDAYDTHFLSWLGRSGVKAVMTPSFPSKTFPNHYTLATGLVPDHHGIIGNQFKVAKSGRVFRLGNDVARDGKKYGGDPLWLTAKHQGVKSATVYWVGSDVAVQGDHANYWKDYAQKPLLTLPERVHEVIKLLKKPEDKRPHLVMAYFEQPDSYGHEFGPISRPTRRAMEYMDSLMQVLYNGLMELPIAADINFIVTGDHGMTYLSPERVIPTKKYIKSNWVDEICNDFPTLIYCKQPEYVDSVMNALKDVDHLRVWRKGQCPEYLQYGNNENMGDVIVLPDLGWKFTDGKVGLNTGSHGFDHTYSDMWVAFQAIGPDFKKKYTRTSTFRNVCLYPMVCYLLGLTPSPNDGSLEEVRDLLK